MYLRSFKAFCLLIIILSFQVETNAQNNSRNLTDGRNTDVCKSCETVLEQMPSDVLFGVNIEENGDIIFSMSDKQWFNKLFVDNSYGVSVDLITKSLYGCGISTKTNINLIKGAPTDVVYKNEIVKNNRSLSANEIESKIGKLPSTYKQKTTEGNFILVFKNKICGYNTFLNIDRARWNLLPMGFYTDSLVSGGDNMSDDNKEIFTYSKITTLEFPFAKGSAAFKDEYLKKVYDSIKLSTSIIKKVEIRAYSSIEGTEKVNKDLMSKRAESIIKALRRYQAKVDRVNIITAENWLDFFRDINNTPFQDLGNQSKEEIKQKLISTKLSSDIEPILSKHRKVILTLYLESKTIFSTVKDTSILQEFQKAIIDKNIAKAQAFQKEIAGRISEKRLPEDYLNKIEVPTTKEFSPLLNDREVYRLVLKQTEQFKALEKFLEIKKLDPKNGRINYNICVLRLFVWQYGGDSIAPKVLLNEFTELVNQDIPLHLINRMKINYYILKSEDQINVQDYKGKDKSVQEIYNLYKNFEASDEDIFSLAKFYTYYSKRDLAIEIVEPRIASVNVSEDLVFYYINLLFFNSSNYDKESFKSAVLNGVNLNKSRYCTFFNSINNGGASMQLLDDENLKKIYCEECRLFDSNIIFKKM